MAGSLSTNLPRMIFRLTACWVALTPCAIPGAPQGAPTKPRDLSLPGTPREDVLPWQIALEARGFSPGLIDGVFGPKTQLALRAYQISMDLPPTGLPDDASAASLEVAGTPPLADYVITSEDEAEVSFCPPDWNEKSRRSRLLYQTLSSAITEKHHTSERCLSALNPPLTLSNLKAGDGLRVPALLQSSGAPEVASLEIDLSRKIILLLSRANKITGLLHCSVARDLSNAERGACQVQTIVIEPNYTFDPKKWPEVKNVDRKLTIPPGPRCPVGLRWIGLDRAGVGIHGTPEPENIGKTGSHGCFRLTNWDAIWLAGVVRVGTPVRIVDSSELASAIYGEAKLPKPREPGICGTPAVNSERQRNAPR